MSGLALLAASAASTASSARGGGQFDPASALPFVTPLLVVVPLALLLMTVIGVRGRRAAANVALLTVVVTAGLLGMAAWALARKAAPYDATYTWLSLTLSFQGASRFASYAPSVSLRLNHLNLLLAGAALAVSLLTTWWSRLGARGEGFLARYYGLHILLLAGALGVILSVDLAALYAFWLAAAVATYLLLSHSWADEAGTRGARLALALAGLGDLALLAGLALLYSRYGQLQLDALIPILDKTPGAGPKALAVAGMLIFSGAAVRVGLFPLHGWLTGAADSPPGAQAAANGMWPVMAAALLYKVLPVLVSASNGAPLRFAAVACAVSAVLLPLLALVAADFRRGVVSAGIALSAVATLTFARPTAIAPAALALAASGLIRAGAALAAPTLAAAYRSVALRDLGEAWRRVRMTVLGLLLPAVVALLLPAAAAGTGQKWWWIAAEAAGLALAVLAVARVGLVAVFQPLARRRGFEPNRIREAPAGMTYPALLLALAGGGLAVATYVPAAMRWADAKDHDPLPGTGYLWLAAGAAGLLLAYLLFGAARHLGARVNASTAAGGPLAVRLRLLGERYLAAPGLGLPALFESAALERGEEGLGGELAASARIGRGSLPSRLPGPALLALLAVVAVAVGLALTPAVWR